MATRRPRPYEERLSEVVRSLYTAGFALGSVGVVATVLAGASLVASAGSVGQGVTTAVNAVGQPPTALDGVLLVVDLGVFAVVAACWLVGAGLVVDGVNDA
jgi:hypothetical protein